MTLDPNVTYPSIRSYVLKLHRDASPSRGRIHGRVENMASGHYFEFASGDELIAVLARDLIAVEFLLSGTKS